jgi:hypothetical protein
MLNYKSLLIKDVDIIHTEIMNGIKKDIQHVFLFLSIERVNLCILCIQIVYFYL